MGYASQTNGTHVKVDKRVLSDKTFLRNALNRGEKGIGMWLTLPGSGLCRALSTIPGFNWFLIDAEHGLITDRDYYDLNQHLTSSDISPIIRIPSDEGWMIKRALDSGAHGVMTPMCHNADIARRIVNDSKFAPRGVRGCGSPFTHHVFRVAENTYETTCDDYLLVIPQIESTEGVKNAEEIAKVEGVDILFIGPFDLAKSMNVEFGGDEHEAAISRVLKAAHSNGKKAAIFCSSGSQGKRRLDQGFDMVSIGVDSECLIAEGQRQIDALS